jgi:hypothetical protein
MQISILIFLKSSKGKIPAGSANIPIKSEKEHSKCSIKIEKCPDKSASV